jgi:hypothetical protein
LSFDKLTIYTKLIADLADKPNMSGADLKAYFDSSPEEIRVAFNALIDGLKSTTSGDSGAKNIGVTSISGLTGNDIQALLGALKTLVDTKTDKSGDHPGTWQGFNATQVDATVGGRLDALEAEHSDQNVQTVVIPHGLSIIETDQKTPLDIAMDGRTLVNGLGKLGNPEATGKGTLASITEALDSANYVVGSNSIKITASGTTSVEHYYALKNYNGSLNWDVKANTNYLIGVHLKPNVGKVRLRVIVRDSANAVISDNVGINVTDTTKFTYTKLKINTGASGATVEIRVQLLDSAGVGAFITSATAENANFDAISLYELSTSQANEIDILTSDEVAEKYGYVDSVKHIQNPVFVSYGKNLAGRGIEWESDGLGMSYTTSIIGGETYTISRATTDAITHIYLDDEGTQTSTITEYTSTAPTWATKIKLSTSSSIATEEDVDNAKIQLELGSVATAFEIQNKTYLYGKDVKIGSNLDGTVADQLIDRNSMLKRFELDKVLDGSLGWAFTVSGDAVGYKKVNITLASIMKINTKPTVVKYDGKILKNHVTGDDAPDIVWNDTDTIEMWISDTDTGWLEAWTGTNITESWIDAYFNGFKYTGDGTTHTWVSVYDGTASPTQTLAYVSANRASGMTDDNAYKLSYQLADAVVEPVTMEGALNLIEGLNQVEVTEGVIVREKATTAYSSGKYFINSETTSELNHRLKEFISIYKDGVDDTSKWNTKDTAFSHGNYRASIPEADFDTTAQYPVTYLVLDKHLFTANGVEAEGTYNTNLKTVVDNLVGKVADINTKQSQQDIWNMDVGVTGNKLKIQVGNAGASVAVTFDQAFSSVPRIYPSDVTAKTATGFTMNASGGDWIAIGNK